jgi:hypothetical protein
LSIVFAGVICDVLARGSAQEYIHFDDANRLQLARTK